MKNAFRAYYPPSESESRDLWERGLIILDANALLVFYRYSARTRDEFLRVLTDKQESLWLPHQVGLEFHRNRLKVVAEQKRAFERTIKFLTSLNEQAHESISKLNIRRHIALDVDMLEKRLSKRIDKVAADVRRLQKEHSASLQGGEDDKILSQIAELYEDKVGEPFSEEQLKTIYNDGRDRYAREQPPGYKDTEKGEPGMYGDLVLWRQILDKGAESKRPVIFVTDDLKEDWWLVVSGEKKGPRPELIEEYLSSSGNRIQFYTPQSFLHFASTRGATVSSETQDEVKEVSRAHALLMGAPLDDDRVVRWLTASTEDTPDLPASFAPLRQELRRLQERQAALYHRRNQIERLIARIDEDAAMLDDGLPSYSEQRATIDRELIRVTEKLGALQHEIGRHSLIEGHHPSRRASGGADHKARDIQQRVDLHWPPVPPDDDGPAHTVARPKRPR